MAVTPDAVLRETQDETRGERDRHQAGEDRLIDGLSGAETRRLPLTVAPPRTIKTRIAKALGCLSRNRVTHRLIPPRTDRLRCTTIAARDASDVQSEARSS